MSWQTQKEMMNLWQAIAETNLPSFLLERLTRYKHQHVSKAEVTASNFTKQCALRSRYRIIKDQLDLCLIERFLPGEARSDL